MIRVYVAGPISKGDYLVNLRKAIDAAHELRERGFLPFVPHAMSSQWHLVYPRDYEDWMAYDFAWLEACHALLRIPGESSGADREVVYAREKGIPVFESIDDLYQWAINTLKVAKEF